MACTVLSVPFTNTDLFPNRRVVSHDIGHLAIQFGLIKARGFPWTYRDSSGNTIGEG